MVKLIKSFTYKPKTDYKLKKIRINDVATVDLDYTFNIDETNITDSVEVNLTLGSDERFKISGEISAILIDGEVQISTIDDIDFDVEEQTMYIVDETSIEGKELLIIKGINDVVMLENEAIERIIPSKKQVTIRYGMTMSNDVTMTIKIVVELDHDTKKMTVFSTDEHAHLIYELV